MRPNHKARGLRELAKQDWQNRIDALLDLSKKKMQSHQIVDGKINKVPLDVVLKRAEEFGLTVVQTDGMLHITRPSAVKA